MRAVHRLGTVCYFLCAALALAAVCTVKTEPLAHSRPAYPCADLTFAQQKNVFSAEEYKLLYCQTGLGPAAVDALCAAGESGRLLFFQRQYFSHVQWDCQPGSPVTCQEVSRSPAEFAPLEAGDILLTPCSHCGGWRNGHAALVLDAENGLTLEAVVMGENSEVRALSSWKNRPSFIVLRLKEATAEKRAGIARAAKESLCGLPYSLTAGLFENEEAASLTGTQCAHLVWRAYADFGYELDSDGGLVVTPRDIAYSPLLEVVQIYGIPAGKRWPDG